MIALNDLARDWWLPRAIVYVGRLDDSKGVGTILSAFADVAERHGLGCPPLWVIGGSPAEIESVRWLDARVNSLEERRLIEWWGYQHADAIAGILLKASVLVMHSRYEPGGRVVLEALAEGVPVIGTPHGFAAELVEDWSTGFLVPFGEREMLRDRIEHFVRQPLLRNALGRRAALAAARALDAWRFISTHCETYEAVMAGSETPHTAETPTFVLDRNWFDGRDFAPTYPYSIRPIDDFEVESFIESHLGTGPERVALEAKGSSHRWRRGQHLVKQALPRMEIRPLWDRVRPVPLARTAAERIASEAFAASHDGFVSVDAVEREAGLLLRRWFPSPTIESIDEWITLAAALRAVRSTPLSGCGEIHKLISENWQAASPEQCAVAIQKIMNALTESEQPWYPGPHVSLSLSWRAARFFLRVPDGWEAGDEAALDAFGELVFRAKEERLVLCHGTPHLDHFVLSPDGPLLIDGEQVHPGADGQDLAYFWLDGTTRWQEQDASFWTEILLKLSGTTSPTTIVFWAALFVYEGLSRHTLLRRPRHLGRYRRQWRLLCEIGRLLKIIP